MRGPFAAALLLMAVGLTVAPALAADDHVGAARCGSCHEAEYKQWRSSGHANALARLSKVQQNDATCRTCHTMVPNSRDPELAGVQCESCHGPGRKYEPEYVMRDPKLAALLGLLPVEASTCVGCHTQDAPSVEPFLFTEKVELVKHKKAEAQP